MNDCSITNTKTPQAHQCMKTWKAYSMGLISCVFLLMVTFGVYQGVLDNEFVGSWDDSYYVIDNSFVNSGFSFQNIKSAFTEIVAHNWHPITMLSHMLDVELFGLQPKYHHLTNLLLHCSNTVLVYLFLLITTKKSVSALLVALIFGIHPLHVESVAWVSERKDLLSSFFILNALCVYRLYTLPNSTRRSHLLYIAVCLLHIFGLMSKTMVITFPFLLLILDYWPLDRYRHNNIKSLFIEKIPLILFSCIFVYITLQTQKGIYNFNLKNNLSTVLYSYFHHFMSYFVPANLSYLYSYSVKPSFVVIIFGIISTLGIFCVIFAFGNRYRFLASGLMMYIILYLPVSGIIRVGVHLYADRYMYLPMLGLSIIVVYGITTCFDNLLLTVPVFITVIMVLSCITFQYEKTWNSQFTVYMNAIKVGSLGDGTKERIRGNVYVAEYYYNHGDFDSAIPHFHNALMRKINYSESGSVLLSKSIFYELSDYSKLILDEYLIEDITNSYNVLATIYMIKRDYYDALIIINRGLSVNRNNKFLLNQKQVLKDNFLE